MKKKSSFYKEKKFGRIALEVDIVKNNFPALFSKILERDDLFTEVNHSE
jgi:hypothetical protein